MVNIFNSIFFSNCTLFSWLIGQIGLKIFVNTLCDGLIWTQGSVAVCVCVCVCMCVYTCVHWNLSLCQVVKYTNSAQKMLG